MDLSRLRADLTRDEGLKLAAYQDTNGFWTIGVGHLLGADGLQPRMLRVTNDEAMALLDWDIEIATNSARAVFDCGTGANSNLWHLLDDVRQRALVNMAFNRGEKRMRESSTITPAIITAFQTFPFMLNDQAWAAVADAILASPWAKQIGHRAERLAYMLKTGKDPA